MWGPYFGDDLLYIFQGWPLDWRYFFTHLGYDPHAYRPLQNFTLAAIQSWFGWETWPIHSIAFLVHACLCGLIFVAARRLKFSMMQAAVAMAFAMLWQFAAGSVVGNDALSQLASTLFGFASLLAISSARQGAAAGRRVALLAASVFCYTIAAFFKETSAGYLAVIIICIVVFERDSGPAQATRVATFVAPYLVVEAFYFVLRNHAGALQPSNVYHLGLNLFKNVGLFLGAVTPVSSVTTMRAVRHSDFVTLLAVGVLFTLTVALAIIGVRKCGQSRLAVFLLLLSLLALAPLIPLPHVSEVYLYGAMPFVALLFAMSIGALLDYPRWRIPGRVFIVLSLALNAQATYWKATMADANGRSAMAMLDVIRRVLPEVPQNGRILLVDSPADSDYSIFMVHGFGVMAVGDKRVGPLLGRADVDVKVVTPAQARDVPQDGRSFIFTFQDGAMRGPQRADNPSGHVY